MGDATCNQEILARLIAQHDTLHIYMARCLEVADEVERTGCRDGEPLIGHARLLLEALLEHQQTEEALLGPVLLDADAFGEVRVGQMTEGHRAEHAAAVSTLRKLMLIADAGIAARALRAAVASIHAHMDAEEEQFLNDRVVRDDLVVVDPFGG